MKNTNPLTFYALRFWTQGFSFWESYVLVLTSAIVVSLWFKWHLTYLLLCALAVAFYVTTPQKAWVSAKCHWAKRPRFRTASP
jgi:hypothetical protein